MMMQSLHLGSWQTAHVICLRKGMEIKPQIFMKHTEILPDENEMSVLTDCFKLHATLKL